MNRAQTSLTIDEARTLIRCFPDCTSLRETCDPRDVIETLSEFDSLGTWLDEQLQFELRWFEYELDGLLAGGANEVRERQAHTERMQQARDALRALGLLDTHHRP